MAFTEKFRCKKKNNVTNETSGIYHTNKFYESFFLFHLQVIHERPWEK